MTCGCPMSHSPAEKPSCCSTHHPMKQPHKVLVTHGNATRHHAGRKKGRKTHTSIPLILHSTLFGMRLIKEGWFHLLAPGPEVTDRSSEVTDRSWLNHSHNNAAKRICLHPPEDLQRKGKGVDHTWLPPLTRTSHYSPIWHVTVVLLGQIQYHTLTSAKIQLMRHLMFVFSKRFLTFQWDSILTVQTWILWLSVRVPDEV